MIVDCHMHIWKYPDHFKKDIIRLNVPPKKRDMPDDWFKQAWDSPIERYLELGDGVVDKAIMLGIHFPQTLGISVPNDFLASTAKKYPDKLAWCCCVNPTEKGAAKEVERCVKELGAVGVGEIGPVYQWFYVDDEKCFPLYEKIQELGVPLVIHAGPSTPQRCLLKYAEVLRLDEVAYRFPNMKIVICHLGSYKYEDAVYLIKKHPNVFGDISLLTAHSGLDKLTLSKYLPEVQFSYYHWLYPLLYYFTQTFGQTDKLLWGTDWSGCSPKTGVELLSGVNKELKKYDLPEIPEKSIHNILHENWKKVFKLES